MVDRDARFNAVIKFLQITKPSRLNNVIRVLAPGQNNGRSEAKRKGIKWF